MSKFYGQVEGMANTVASRRGSQNIKSSVQSYEGSIITEIYTRYDQTLLDIYYDSDTSFYRERIFTGSINEFVELLKKYENEKEAKEVY